MLASAAAALRTNQQHLKPLIQQSVRQSIATTSAASRGFAVEMRVGDNLL